jgi:hypothetical protein
MSTDLLEEAKNTVDEARQRDYGDPSRNLELIGDLWSALLGVHVSAESVARCMILAKVARDVHAPKRDNLVDIAGYAYCIDKIRTSPSPASCSSNRPFVQESSS